MRAGWMLVMLTACGRVAFDPLPDADTGPRLVDAALGITHTCVRASTGELACWGNNDWGKLGVEDERERSRPARVDIGTQAIADITSLADFTCALVDTGVKCWGNNDGAQLGAGDFAHRGDDAGEMGVNLAPIALSPGPPVEQVVAGHYHACARRAGSVLCWGMNDVDQTGYAARKITSAELAALPDVALGAFTAVHLVAQFNSTCAVDPRGDVKCWGANFSGNLGLGDRDPRGANIGEMGDALPFVELGMPVRELASGLGHTCAIGDAGLKCWGDNFYGELGIGTTDNRGDEAGEMGDALPFVDLDGTAVTIAGGDQLTCAVLADGRVKCWGQNAAGQLCTGDTDPRGDAPGEMGAALPAVPLPRAATAVFTGGRHACALLADHSLACWGGNDQGQLGDGTHENLGDQLGETPVIHTYADLFGP